MRTILLCLLLFVPICALGAQESGLPSFFGTDDNDFGDSKVLDSGSDSDSDEDIRYHIADTILFQTKRKTRAESTIKSDAFAVSTYLVYYLSKDPRIRRQARLELALLFLQNRAKYTYTTDKKNIVFSKMNVILTELYLLEIVEDASINTSSEDYRQASFHLALMQVGNHLIQNRFSDIRAAMILQERLDSEPRAYIYLQKLIKQGRYKAARSILARIKKLEDSALLAEIARLRAESQQIEAMEEDGYSSGADTVVLTQEEEEEEDDSVERNEAAQDEAYSCNTMNMETQ